MKIYDALQARNQPRLAGSVTPLRRSLGAVRDVRLRPEDLVSLYQTAAALLPKGAPPVFQVMSARPGEGTSTIARALSLAVAETTGRRVLLLQITATRQRRSETDDRPGLEAALPRQRRSETDDRPGLEAALRGELDIEKALSKPGDEPLFIASLAGESVAGQAGPMSLRELLERLGASMAVIIIDAPAALTDFAGLATVALVGGVLLVVEAERTRSPIVREAKRLIEANGGRILGVVLNKRRRYIPRIIYRWL